MPVPHPPPTIDDPEPETRPLLLRIDQAAEALTVSRSTLERLVRRGQVVPVHIGKSIRFRPEMLEAFIIERERDEAVDFAHTITPGPRREAYRNGIRRTADST